MKYLVLVMLLSLGACTTTQQIEDPTHGKGGFIDADGGY